MEFTKENYAIAYREVLEVLSCLSLQNLKMIPKDIIEYYYTSMDKNHKYIVDVKNFENQPMSELTEILLANLFIDYLATPTQKERIKAKEKLDMDKIEEELLKRYHPSDIFKSRTSSVETIENEKETALKVYEKMPLYKRIFIKVKKFFSLD